MTQLDLLAPRCRFYLGVHEPAWLSAGRLRGPAFLSAYRLYRKARKSPYPKGGRPAPCWALDSGAFSMVSGPGRWVLGLEEYAAARRRYAREFGAPVFAAPQDYMCEPWVLAKSGMTVAEAQRLTIDRYLDLCRVAPDLEWMPVLQGWALDDYLRHVDAYAAAGVDLLRGVVGVGSTCRRQGTEAAGAIYTTLHRCGLRLHGFGVSLAGVRRYHRCLASADSMAWSSAARRMSVDPAWAANALPVAEAYRRRVQAAIDEDDEEAGRAAQAWQELMREHRPSRRAA